LLDSFFNRGMSLHNAARAMGIKFSHDALPQDKYFESDGMRFHYLDWGNTSNPTIIMLHGFAQQSHSWDFVALGLCDKFRIVAFDQRGHGDSDWSEGHKYSLNDYHNDIDNLVEHLGLTETLMVGMSMGGRNAFTYAANHQDLVSALVVVDAAPVAQSSGRDKIRNFVSQEDVHPSIEEFVRMVHGYTPNRPIDQIWGSIKYNVKQIPDGSWTWKYDKFLRSPDRDFRRESKDVSDAMWASLDMLKAPTLLVVGEDSDIVSQDIADQMINRISNSKLVSIPNAGHRVMGDNPVAFQDAINDFLSNI
jgi:pimeloyl-ACP methyl ester carboxylesterase